jgi:RNA polymerase sigma factor (sigma-70 family)
MKRKNVEDVVCPGLNPEERLIESESQEEDEMEKEMEKVTELVAGLPADLRQIIEARYFNGASQVEVADALGLCERQVRRREVTALRRMRASVIEEV